MTQKVDGPVEKKDFKELIAAGLMKTEVIYFTKNAIAKRLIVAMTMGGFGSVPIVDRDKTLIGIVSEFDLLKALRQGRSPDQFLAGEIMSSPAISVTEKDKVEEIMEILEKRKLIRVPVVNRDGKLVGVIARRDILTAYLKSASEGRPWWM